MPERVMCVSGPTLPEALESLITRVSRLSYKVSDTGWEASPIISKKLRLLSSVAYKWARQVPGLGLEVAGDLLARICEALESLEDAVETGDEDAAAYWAGRIEALSLSLDAAAKRFLQAYRSIVRISLGVFTASLMVIPIITGVRGLGGLVLYIAAVSLTIFASVLPSYSLGLLPPVLVASVVLASIAADSPYALPVFMAVCLAALMGIRRISGLVMEAPVVETPTPPSKPKMENPEEALEKIYMELYGDRWKDLLEYDLRSLMKRGMSREQAVALRLKELGEE